MARSTRTKPDVDPRAAESFSGEGGADVTAADFVPKWLEEQNKGPQVPVNYYAEYQAKNFGDETPDEADAVHSLGKTGDEQ